MPITRLFQTENSSLSFQMMIQLIQVIQVIQAIC